MSLEPSRAATIEEIVDRVIEQRSTGHAVRLSDVIRTHRHLAPELSRRLRLLGHAMRASDRWPSHRSKAAEPTLELQWLRDGIPGYELLQIVNRGGQGIVYRARQCSTNRIVAVKLLPEGPFADRRKRQRFLREIDILTHICHANLVRAFDAGRIDGADYVVLEYVDGMPIDDYAILESLGTGEILRLFASVSDAVGAAHRYGIIHRDLKPSNILVDDLGVPHVLDFGLAKTVVDDGAAQTISITGHIVGSPPYLAPEQVLGARADARSDVYALGVVLYETLSGSLPYLNVCNRRELLEQICDREPPRLRDVVMRYGVNPALTARDIKPDLQRLVRNALAKDPARRYQSVGEFAADIDRVLTGDPVLERTSRALRLLRTGWRRHRALGGVLTTVCLALLIIAFARDAQKRREAEVVEQAETAMEMAGLLTLGSTARDGGRMDEAARRFEAAAAIARRFDRPTARLSHQLFRAKHRAAELKLYQDKPDEALVYVQAAVQTAEDLIASDPDNPMWRRVQAFARRLQGRYALAIGDRAGARRHLDAAIARFTELPEQTSHLAASHCLLARCLMESGSLSDAVEAYRRAERIYEDLAASSPEFHIDLAATHVKLGVLQVRAGDRARGVQRFRQALHHLELVGSSDAAITRQAEIARIRSTAEVNLARFGA